MILNKITIKNFKGIKNLQIDFNGRNTNISGENATGKTTVYDSFLWLLFDKDSTNRKDFNLKTIDKLGSQIHMLEHEVEATIEVNGKEITIRKVMEEKWTKKRGSAEQEFSGHETSCYIDEVPVKKSEYQDKINNLIDENIFKLLTNPVYFNTMLKWQDRRTMLLSITGDMSDEQVIDSDIKLISLREILNGKSTEDYGKIIKEKIKRLNEDIEKIPTRIDELNHNKETLEKIDYESIEKEKEFENMKLNAIDEQLNSAVAVNQKYNNKLIEISQLKNKLATIEREIQFNASREGIDTENKLNNLISEKKNIEFRIDTLKQTIESVDKYIEECNKKKNELYKKYDATTADKFYQPDDNNFNCTTCGQSLPGDDIKTKIEDMRNSFNKNKLETIEKINVEGKFITGDAKAHELRANEYKTELDQSKELLTAVINNIAAIELEIKTINDNKTEIDYTSSKEYTQIKAEIAQLELELNKPVEDITTALKQEKIEIQNKINELNKQLANQEVEIKTNARIEQLELEERNLAEKIAELEGHRYLIEEFIKTKVNMLEEFINSKFKVVRFKLFDTQINGGLNECCETLVNGVPYSDVNNAGKINAGMDIIATLIEHFGVKAPIFVDNAESINDLYNLDTQIIRLLVSRDKQLKVEVI